VSEVPRKLKEPSKELIFRLIEETYLELSAALGWRPVNCYYYSNRYNVCYGAPVFLGNFRVWRYEPAKYGLFNVLKVKLRARGYRPINWEEFRELMLEIEKQGVIWVNWFGAPTNRTEPHDITIMRPTFLQPEEV
jgi:hypothetical protein